MAKVAELVELIRRLEERGAPARVIEQAQKRLDAAVKKVCFPSLR